MKDLLIGLDLNTFSLKNKLAFGRGVLLLINFLYYQKLFAIDVQTYCTFIDIQKAYDKVWREALWYKLYKMGIRGKLWRVLRNIYEKVESCVVLGDHCTELFEVLLGLRQGCLLSPMLFDLFINDIVDELKKHIWN